MLTMRRRRWRNKSGGGASTYRRTKWRMSRIETLAFIAAVVIAVALLVA